MQLIPGFDLSSRNARCSICNCNQRLIYTGDIYGPKERVIRTGTLIEMEGIFDVCETCIKEMAKLVDLIPTDERDFANQLVSELIIENDMLRESLHAQDVALSTMSQELATQAQKRVKVSAHAVVVSEEPDFG